MRHLVKFFILFILFNFPNISFSESKIAYINMEVIMSKSKAGASITNELQKIHKSNLSKFQKTEENLKKEEKKILSQKNILEKKEFETKIQELRSKVGNYQKQRRTDIDSLTQKRLKATTELLNQLNPLLAKYLDEKSISILIQKKNIIIGRSELDVTDEVLKLVDQKIKNIKLD